jgi:hypothetical protein
MEVVRMVTVTATAEIEIEIQVEVVGLDTTVDDHDVAQAVQDELGHTGAVVTMLSEWQEACNSDSLP